MDGFLRVPMNVDSFTLPHDFIEKLNTVLDSFAGVG